MATVSDQAASVNDGPATPTDRRGLIAWCVFDWANSPYPTVIVTFVFAAYFAKGIAPDETTGQELWGMAMSASGLALALLAPLVGAIADRGGRRKPWLAALSVLAVLAGAALWFLVPDAGMLVPALILAGLGNLAFEFVSVFYNAMLPDLVPKERLGRVSGWGWGLGYAGGLACLAVALVVFVQPETPPFGLDKTQAEDVRILGPLVAVWFALFAIPLFLFTPDRNGTGVPLGRAAREGFAALVGTFRQVRRYRNILHFLVARMIYIDGLNTLFALGGIYAAGAFDMSLEEVLLFGVLINVTAGIGAFGFAWIDDWIGPKRTVLICIVALAALCVAILVIESKDMFYVLAMLIGVFMGPIQSASRSLMAHMAPAAMRTEMFGLFALSGKVTSFVGPALVAVVTAATDSQRLGMAVIVVLFAVGGLLMLGVREPERTAPAVAIP
ncbi:MAG: MFS transporter [Alphaproteobacteria bacterium]